VWFTWEVSNSSLSDHARPSAVSLWLSTDAEPTVSPGDVYLLSETVGHLPAGARFGKHVGVEAPFAPVIGTAYRIKAMADSAREVAEADEADNVSASAAFTFVAEP
jgi:hypothetical protein